MVKSIVVVVRGRTVGDKRSYERSYYVYTDHLSLDLVGHAAKKYWHIEYQQYWVLDVLFKEDEQQMYAGDLLVNMACCLRFVQN